MVDAYETVKMNFALVPGVTKTVNMAFDKFLHNLDLSEFFRVAKSGYITAPMVVRTELTERMERTLAKLTQATWHNVDQIISELISENVEIFEATKNVVYFNVDSEFAVMVESGNALVVFVATVLRVELISLFNVHKLLATSMASEDVLLAAVNVVLDALAQMDGIFDHIAAATETESKLDVASMYDTLNLIYENMMKVNVDIGTSIANRLRSRRVSISNNVSEPEI